MLLSRLTADLRLKVTPGGTAVNPCVKALTARLYSPGQASVSGTGLDFAHRLSTLALSCPPMYQTLAMTGLPMAEGSAQMIAHVTPKFIPGSCYKEAAAKSFKIPYLKAATERLLPILGCWWHNQQAACLSGA